jgi:hypothetical protein
MTVSDDNGALRATLKAGAGYEAPWLTVGADTAGELGEKLSEVTEELIQQVVDVASLLRAAHTVVAGVAAPAAAAAPSATQTQAPGAGLKTCTHGVRTKRQGTNARGSWTGYFCPLQKGDPNQCKPIFED